MLPSGLMPTGRFGCSTFEFSAPPGERPDPVCLVAREFRSGRTLRLWQDDLRDRRHTTLSDRSRYAVCRLFRRRPSSVATWHSAGSCQSGSWISMWSLGTATNGLDPPLRLRMLGSAGLVTAWTRWMRRRKGRCRSLPSRWTLVRIRTASSAWLLCQSTFWRWPNCYQRWSRVWISAARRRLPGPVCAVRCDDGMGRSADRCRNPRTAPRRLGID